MRTFVARAWRSWTGLSMHIGDFQARALLTLIYFTWLVPFGVLVRLFSDPLDIRSIEKPLTTSAWGKRIAQKRDLRSLRGQF